MYWHVTHVLAHVTLGCTVAFLVIDMLHVIMSVLTIHPSLGGMGRLGSIQGLQSNTPHGMLENFMV